MGESLCVHAYAAVRDREQDVRLRRQLETEMICRQLGGYPAYLGGDPQLLMFAQPYTKYLTSTIISLKNTLDWMSGDSDLIAASAKLIGDASLTYSSVSKPKFKAEDDDAEIKRKDEEYRAARKNLQRNVQWWLILGMPAAFGAFGLFRWRSRQSRRDQMKA